MNGRLKNRGLKGLCIALYGSDGEGALTESVVDGAVAATVIDAREGRILCMYFGLNGLEPTTMKAIARDCGLSCGRIMQLRDRALSRMRKGEGRVARINSWMAERKRLHMLRVGLRGQERIEIEGLLRAERLRRAAE